MTVDAKTHPLTRDELREELDRTLQHYATKADLADVKSDLKDLELKLTIRLVGVVAVATGVIIAVDRLAA